MSKVLPFPSPARLREAATVDRLRARDRDAMTEVYLAHQSKVRAFARRMLHDEVAAEDVVHDVFVALPDALDGYRGDASLGTFLVSIALNMCRRRVRATVRGERAAAHIQKREAEAVTPEHEARRRQLAETLARGLANLSMEHREVFVLSAVEERSAREVAEILDVPEATVRTRLFYARKHLRAFLEREGVR